MPLKQITTMKKLFVLCLLFLLSSHVTSAQADEGMKARLDTFMQLNQSLQFDKLMDYIYPKVFTIAPREQLVQVFKESFAGNDELSMEMDSLRTGTISTPVTIGEGSYYLISYSMLIRIKMINEKADASNSMLGLMKSQYGEDNVRHDKATGKYVITVNTSMVAIKDALSPQWSFLNFEPDHPLAAQLLDEAVITKLKSFTEEQKN